MGGRPDQAGGTEETAECTAPGGPGHDRLLPDDLNQHGGGAGGPAAGRDGCWEGAGTAYCHGHLSRRLEIIRTPCEWSPHLWHVRQLLLSTGIRLDWSFERHVQNHEMDYPPLRVEVRVVLGTRDSWAEGEVLRRVGRIFTDGSKQQEGVGPAFVAVDGQGRELATGLSRLPPWVTIFKAAGPWSGARTFSRRGVGSLARTRTLCCPMC